MSISAFEQNEEHQAFIDNVILGETTIPSNQFANIDESEPMMEENSIKEYTELTNKPDILQFLSLNVQKEILEKSVFYIKVNDASQFEFKFKKNEQQEYFIDIKNELKHTIEKYSGLPVFNSKTNYYLLLIEEYSYYPLLYDTVKNLPRYNTLNLDKNVEKNVEDTANIVKTNRITYGTIKQLFEKKEYFCIKEGTIIELTDDEIEERHGVELSNDEREMYFFKKNRLSQSLTEILPIFSKQNNKREELRNQDKTLNFEQKYDIIVDIRSKKNISDLTIKYNVGYSNVNFGLQFYFLQNEEDNNPTTYKLSKNYLNFLMSETKKNNAEQKTQNIITGFSASGLNGGFGYSDYNSVAYSNNQKEIHLTVGRNLENTNFLGINLDLDLENDYSSLNSYSLILGGMFFVVKSCKKFHLKNKKNGVNGVEFIEI